VRGSAIWWYALGYFLSYWPYSALTSALSHGLLPGYPKLTGTSILPLSASASLVGMFIFISAIGWWRFAGRRRIFGREMPCPNRWTFFSGVCSAGVILTTTLAYTFGGVSILFMMVLMRGGVLCIAPIVDLAAQRKVRATAWAALAISLVAVGTNLYGNTDYRLSATAAVDLAFYLAAYFVRMRFMSRLAKSSDENASRRYFVEEQMVATPAAVLLLTIGALVGPHVGWEAGHQLAYGFSGVLTSKAGWLVVMIGIFSQGTGIFGALILLDPRENSFCMPLNRASSMIAGVLASASLALAYGAHHPTRAELVGAGLLVSAILILGIPGVLKARAKT
jgi:hypothetical protein